MIIHESFESVSGTNLYVAQMDHAYVFPTNFAFDVPHDIHKL